MQKMPIFHYNFFILGSVLLYLSDKEIVVAVSFFFLSKVVLSLVSQLYQFVVQLMSYIYCCSINELFYTHVSETDWSFSLCNLRILAVKNIFVLSVKLGCSVCYLSAISGALMGHQGNLIFPLVSYILLFVVSFLSL